MAYPLHKDVPETWTDEPYSGETIFRTSRGSDGRLKVLQLPATRENLLDPRLEDKVTQNNAHARLLSPLAVALRTELEERDGPAYGVFEDLMLLLKHHPGFSHDSGPDVMVVSGIKDPENVEESVDVIAQGLGVPLIVEVVSTKYKDSREKDEIDNVPVYDRLGVGDYVMVYPRIEGRGEPLRLKALTRSPLGPRGGGRHGSLVDNPPNPQGRILIRSLGLWFFIDDEQRLALEDVKTGKRIWFHIDERRLRLAAQRRAEEQQRRAEKQQRRAEEQQRRAEEQQRRAEEQQRRAEQEAEARRQAERHAEKEAEARRKAEAQSAEMLIVILESRGLTLTEEDRRRILDFPDLETLRRWTAAAVHVHSPSELWDD